MTNTLCGPDNPIFPLFPKGGRKKELKAINKAHIEESAAEQTVIQNP